MDFGKSSYRCKCSLFNFAHFRDAFSTVTFVNNKKVLEKTVDIFNAKVAFAKSRAVGEYNMVYLIQPIPKIFSQHSVERGGNVLGLDRFKDNLICTSNLTNLLHA